MEHEELIKILEAESPDVKHCSVCGMPYIPYHSRQKTCGEPECKKAQHNQYVKEYQHREENKVKVETARIRYRLKKRAEKTKMENFDKIEEHWKRQQEFDEKITKYGDHYGEMQKQKILSSIPKIKTEL